jgi:hypothetical protein
VTILAIGLAHDWTGAGGSFKDHSIAITTINLLLASHFVLSAGISIAAARFWPDRRWSISLTTILLIPITCAFHAATELDIYGISF